MPVARMSMLPPDKLVAARLVLLPVPLTPPRDRMPSLGLTMPAWMFVEFCLVWLLVSSLLRPPLK